MAYTKYSLTPANNNAAPPNGAPEGMLPSAVNDTMRDMMAEIRDCGDGIRTGVYALTAPIITGGSINGSTVGASTASTGRFTSVTATGLTSGRVAFVGAAGLLQDDADFTFNGTTATMVNDASISGLTVGKGGGAISTNTAVGSGALVSNTTGSSNTASGLNALRDNTTGNNNTANGLNALVFNTTGGGNTASGLNTLFANTTGSANTANGVGALQSNTTGSNSTASGFNALLLNTTGSANTANGVSALQSNTTGNNNTASGFQALLSNTTGIFNTANGAGALQSNTTGSNSTASGFQALVFNTTGSSNTASGFQALLSNTTGSFNTANGAGALQSNTTGSGNTALSPQNSAGVFAPVFNPTTENNRFCMGSTGVTNAYIQVAWTVVSDARDKTDFAPVPHGLAFVTQLNPIAYRYKMNRSDIEGHGPLRYGFKAQEVLTLEGDTPVIVDAEDADKLRFNDQSMIAVLVKAIQELKAEFDTYKSTHP